MLEMYIMNQIVNLMLWTNIICIGGMFVCWLLLVWFDTRNKK